MARRHTPGVYFEWQDRRRAGFAPARADIAGMIGIARRGPVGVPVAVQTWNQFTSEFGAHTAVAHLAWAAEGFFANGGRRCWIVRVASGSAQTARWTVGGTNGPIVLSAASPGTWARELSVSVSLEGDNLFTLALRLPDGSREVWPNLSAQPPYVDFAESAGGRALRIEARDPALWPSPPALSVNRSGAGIAVSLPGRTPIQLSVDPADTRRLQISGDHEPTGLKGRFLGASDRLTGEPRSLESGSAPFVVSPRFAGALLNHPEFGSHFITIESIAGALRQAGPIQFTDGADGLADLSRDDFQAALDRLAEIDEIAVLTMPDLMPKPAPPAPRPKAPPSPCSRLVVETPVSGIPDTPLETAPAFDRGTIEDLQQAMILQCELLKDRFAILDHPAPSDRPAEAIAWRGNFDSSYAAHYYPWLKTPDPLRTQGLLRATPPSGHMAGIYARVEAGVGPHKAPANEVLEACQDVTFAADDVAQGLLNDSDVNVIRPCLGRDLRAAGARTVSNEGSWRYIGTRRLFIMLERSIRANAQWIVFEPNNPALWIRVDRLIRSFLEDLWQRGFLDGASRAEAYTVRCDASTNPSVETDAGRVICEIGVLPPWPAEFVIVRIGITEGGVEMITATEAQIA